MKHPFRTEPVRAWLALLACVAALAYAFAYQIQPGVDAAKFHAIASNLVTVHRFCYECTVPIAQDTAIRDIGPAYQFFLASIYEAFGIRVWAVWLIQALLHGIVVWWLYGLARRFVTNAKPWQLGLAIGLYAFHPDVIQQQAMLMSEALFLFFLVASFRTAVALVDNEAPKYRWHLAALTGLLLGATTMTRPTGLPLFVAFLIFLGFRRRWKELFVVLACFIAIEAPWTIRNLRTYDHFVFNSVVGGLDFWIGLDPNGSGVFNLDALPYIREKIAGLTADQVDYVSTAEAKKIIVEHPVFAVERTVQKGFKLFALTKTSGFWFHYRSTFDQLLTILSSILFNLILLGAGFAAFFDIVRSRRVRHWAIGASVVIVFCLAVAPTLTVVVNRYRVPMLPFLSLLFLDWWVNVKGRERVASLLFSGAFLAVATGVDLWGSFPKIMERIQTLRSRAL